ncbi:MAG: hypothetical protein ABIP94_05690 [Planctomycetota bacterium]
MTGEASSKQPPSPGAGATLWSFAWAGFYLSCALVALGATLAGGGWFFFGSTGWLVFGCVMSAVSSIACFFTLRAARRSLAASL